METSFKTCVFGGFDREDVISYIRKTAEESQKKLEALMEETERLRVRCETAESELSALRTRSAELEQQLADTEVLRAEAERLRAEGEIEKDRAEAAARRELREETGITARELIPLGPFYPAAAYSDEVIWMYLARGLTFGEQQLDDDEFLNLQAVPLDELARDVLAGRIPDAKTQAAILRVYCMEHGFEPK